MKVEFPYQGYENIPPVEVPDENLMGVYSPIAMEVDEKTVLEQGFLHPIGAPRLRDAVHGKKSVLILVDDGTRSTPVARFLPLVLQELSAGGIQKDQIAFLTGQGTHRKMTDAELKHKFGEAFGKYQVFQHDWKAGPSEFHSFGKTKDGTPVTANKLLTKYEYIMGLGGIVPHRVKGFSGGAKIAFPGVAGKEMMERNQWEASMQMSETVMGFPENSMRLRMEEAAEMAGLRYIVNVVGDVTGKIVGCFCGDVVKAHREGCKLSRKVTAAHMPGRADIVLIDSYPADRDFWQSAKGLYSGTMAVKEGGTILMVSPNPEGVASNHPNLMRIGYKPHAEIVQLVQSGKAEDLVGVAILADTVQIIDHADCIIATPGFSKQDAEKIGLRWAANGQDGLKMAFEKQGKKAKVAVLRHGGHILPLADDKAVAEHQ